MDIDFQRAIEHAKGLNEVMVGAVVADRYLVESPVGEGAMGHVFAALDQRTGARVALKILKPGLARDESIAARFRREAEAAGQLGSRHTVQIIECDAVGDGSLYIAMEFVDGPSLEYIVDREGPLYPPRALRLVRQVVVALAEAHDLGIVHRDLKPANIMIALVDGAEEAKVADYGIAKLVGAAAEGAPALTAAGMTVGTPEYMAPENATGKQIDARTDLYSVGVLLFEMLEGRLPFSGASLLAVLKAHVTDPVPPLSERVPDSVARLIHRLMAKRPDDRPQNARALLAELDAAAVAAGMDLDTDDPETERVTLNHMCGPRLERTDDMEVLETIVTPALRFGGPPETGELMPGDTLPLAVPLPVASGLFAPVAGAAAPAAPVLAVRRRSPFARTWSAERPAVRAARPPYTALVLVCGVVLMAVLTVGVVLLAQ